MSIENYVHSCVWLTCYDGSLKSPYTQSFIKKLSFFGLTSATSTFRHCVLFPAIDVLAAAASRAFLLLFT